MTLVTKIRALYTIYGHMDEIDVVEGQHVETGDPLGLVGETGTVTGPHLHFEVRLGENSFFTTRNPELWLVPPIGWGIIAGRVMDTAGRLINDQLIIITDPSSEQNWFAWSYGKTSVNSDQYYQENLVIGDMPAGTYFLRAAFWGVYLQRPNRGSRRDGQLFYLSWLQWFFDRSTSCAWCRFHSLTA